MFSGVDKSRLLADTLAMTTSTISYSAPGKIIISGEHSAVHGKAAIASAVNLRLVFSVEPSQKPDLSNPAIETVSIIDRIVQQYLTNHGIEFKVKPYHFAIESTIPVGQGFGSSAALSAAASAALVELYTGKTVEDFGLSTLNEIAYTCEEHFHGTPSGIDNTAAVFGGLIFFRKEFQFLKTIHRLPFSIPTDIASQLLLIHSGDRRETTKEMVDHVHQLNEREPATTKKTLHDLDRTTKQIVQALHDDQPELLKVNVRRNHNQLVKLGVVSDKTQKLIRQLQDFGEAKITGSGGIEAGSGFILMYIHPGKEKKLKRLLDSQAMLYLPFEASQQGVVKES